MESSAWAGGTPRRASEPGSDRGAAAARWQLRFGVVAGPFYLAVGLTQGVVRDGFDFARHPLSALANGTGGWVQTANFVITGLMVIAAAVGFARALRPTSRAVSWFLGGYGAAMLAAAVFPADPVDGFPLGTPVGFPTSISTPGMVHFIAGTLGFVFLAISCCLAAVAMSRRRVPWLARLSWLSGISILLGFFGGFAVPGAGTTGIWFAVVVGWAWLAVMSLHLYRAVPVPIDAA